MAWPTTRDEIPSGTLEMLILKTLQLAREMHGFEIANAIQQRSEGVLRSMKDRCIPHFSGCF